MVHDGTMQRSFLGQKTKHSSVSDCGFSSPYVLVKSPQFIWPSITNPDLPYNPYSIQHLLSLDAL